MEITLSDYDRARATPRFMQYVVKDEKTGCWNWIARRYVNGYGQFWLGKIMKASRASHMIFKGPIPAGLMVLHTCHNAGCVNPEHLYAGTHEQNMIDRDEAGHTSRGEHRYNFIRTDRLLDDIKFGRSSGATIKEICDMLDIGYSTFYRCVKQDPELKDLVEQTKSENYRGS